MSRLARKSIQIPAGVEVNKLANNPNSPNGFLSIKGSKGVFDYIIHPAVDFTIDAGKITVKATKHSLAKPMLGTAVITLKNMLLGASQGFSRKLKLVGVGYRAKVQGDTLELTLGFSHPIIFTAPQGITMQVPSNTEIIIAGADKQVVGQTAAKIRSFRAPECYKGKGVRYDDENINIKQTKKK